MALGVWGYSLVSVFIVSLIAFVGILTIAIGLKDLERWLLYMVSFAAGALIGDAFIHLLPEIVEEVGFGLNISLYVLLGLVSMFVIEKFIHWEHKHGLVGLKNRVGHGIKPFAITNLVGDGVHNFIDGLTIAASYLVSIPVGIATTVAVALHEIPQEVGDFGILVHGGFTRQKALFFNFLSALTAVVGAVIALVAASAVENTTTFLVPLAAGHFIYIAVADLIPELHKVVDWKKSVLQLFFFLLGIAVMFALILLE